MDAAISQWLVEPGITTETPLKLSYVCYNQTLLLASSTFANAEWTRIAAQCGQDDFQRLYELIAKHLKVTHIAINKAVPLLDEDGETENILRSPKNFTPLFGDFGPATCSSPPSRHDYERAYWAEAKQNGIFQIWAPRWTMFSKGNISEKARVLNLPSVQEAVEQGIDDGRGCAAIDLYAGIGYFTFSYLKAGINAVLGWDLNPWSIEGLRRGTIANRWDITICSENEPLQLNGSSLTRVLAFHESNECAAQRVKNLRHRLPPIRHVNLGMLPTSKPSWKAAVEVLDPLLGGWVHVHENLLSKETVEESEEVRAIFQEIQRSLERPGTVRIEGVHRVKSYSAGVLHCVIDLFIPPVNPP